MVRDTGFEPVTPTMSMWCSTPELTALFRAGCVHWRQAILNPFSVAIEKWHDAFPVKTQKKAPATNSPRLSVIRLR